MFLDYKEMLLTISEAFECVEEQLLGITTGHIQRVTYLYLFIAQKMGLSKDKIVDLATCALLHDNAVHEYVREEYYVAMDGDKEYLVGRHCIVGENNMKDFPYRTDMSNIILYHHEHADGSGLMGKMAEDTPLLSRLLHLCDSIDRTCYRNGWENRDYSFVQGYINFGLGTYFDQEVVDLFNKNVSEQDFYYFQHCDIKKEMIQIIPEITGDYSYEKMRVIAAMIARMIDYKSEFTGLHSVQLSEKADRMAEYYCMNQDEQEQFFAASALHDIGKLMIHINILEKNDKLTEEEFSLMKKHVIYTNQMLSKIKGFEQIALWASNHHEKLDGSGYPFGKTAKDLDRNSRLLACLDIYQALTEERPYKKGMSHHKSIDILRQMASDGKLDLTIVNDIATVFEASA